MKYIKCLLALSLLLTSSESFAKDKNITNLKKVQEIEFTLVVVDSPLSPPVEEQKRLFFEGVERLSEVKSKIKITQTIITPDVIQENDIDFYLHRLFSWATWARNNKIKGHVHFLLPPVFSNGAGLGGGVAGAVCTTTRNPKRKFSYSIMRLVNSSGADRQPHSRVIAAHELLHNLGANHIEFKGFDPLPNIMHPNAQIFVTENNKLPILSKTHREVKFCRQGLTPTGNKPTYGIQKRLLYFQTVSEPTFN